MLVDRFVSPSSSRVVDYVAVMTVKLAPQLKEDCDELSDVKQVRSGNRVLRGALDGGFWVISEIYSP